MYETHTADNDGAGGHSSNSDNDEAPWGRSATSHTYSTRSRNSITVILRQEREDLEEQNHSLHEQVRELEMRCEKMHEHVVSVEEEKEHLLNRLNDDAPARPTSRGWTSVRSQISINIAKQREEKKDAARHREAESEELHRELEARRKEAAGALEEVDRLRSQVQDFEQDVQRTRTDRDMAVCAGMQLQEEIEELRQLVKARTSLGSHPSVFFNDGPTVVPSHFFDQDFDQRPVQQIGSNTPGEFRPIKKEESLAGLLDAVQTSDDEPVVNKASSVVHRMSSAAARRGRNLSIAHAVNIFIAENGIHEQAGAALRSAPPSVQQVVVDLGSLLDERHPSSALLDRLDAFGCGLRCLDAGKTAQAVDAFIADNGIDEKAGTALGSATPAEQRAVISLGSLRDARSPSSALLVRLASVKDGSFDAFRFGGTGNAAKAAKAVDDFIEENGVDEAGGAALRSAAPAVQRWVVNRGSFRGVESPSSALKDRLREAQECLTGEAVGSTDEAASATAPAPPSTGKVGSYALAVNGTCTAGGQPISPLTVPAEKLQEAPRTPADPSSPVGDIGGSTGHGMDSEALWSRCGELSSEAEDLRKKKAESEGHTVHLTAEVKRLQAEAEHASQCMAELREGYERERARADALEARLAHALATAAPAPVEGRRAFEATCLTFDENGLIQDSRRRALMRKKRLLSLSVASRKKLNVGTSVKVLRTIIYKSAENSSKQYQLQSGLIGTVTKIDAEGDAEVDWVGLGKKWVLKKDFYKFSVGNNSLPWVREVLKSQKRVRVREAASTQSLAGHYFQVGDQYETRSDVILRSGEGLDSEQQGELGAKANVTLLEISPVTERRVRVRSEGDEEQLEGWMSRTTLNGVLLLGRIEPMTCRSGHPLKLVVDSAADTCEHCGCEVEHGSQVMQCEPCKWVLCSDCHPVDPRLANTRSDRDALRQRRLMKAARRASLGSRSIASSATSATTRSVAFSVDASEC